MYLLLDLSLIDTLHVALFTEDTMRHTTLPGRNRDLLSAVHQALTAAAKTPADVAGIMVVVGTGSFTSTRIATTVANVWSYVRGVPLLAINASDLDRLPSLIPALRANPVGQYIAPVYSGEPRVGSSSNYAL